MIDFLNARNWRHGVFGVEVRRYGSADAGKRFVPRLVGATAAAVAERKQQTSLGEKLAAAPAEISDAAERRRFLAAELGLAVREVRASLRICDPAGSVVLLYPAYWSLEFPLYLLLDAAVGQVRESLQAIAGEGRPIAAKAPDVGCSEALARWMTLPPSPGNLCKLAPR